MENIYWRRSRLSFDTPVLKAKPALEESDRFITLLSFEKMSPLETPPPIPRDAKVWKNV